MRIKRRTIGAVGVAAVLLPLILTPVANSAEVVEGYYTNIDQSQLTAVSASSEEQGGEGPVSGWLSAALDGNVATFWHSKWKGGTDPVPHVIVFGTQDNQPIADIARVTLTPRPLPASGRFKEYELFLRADSACDATEGWTSVKKESVPATERGDISIDFAAQDVACVKIVVDSGWDGADKADVHASLAEINLATFTSGDKPVPPAAPLPNGTEQADRPLPAGVIPSATVLDPLALDERRADNDENTPIALKIPGWNGADRIVGARKSTTPKVANLETSGTNYFVDCQATPDGAAGTQANPWTSMKQVNVHGKFAAGDQILFKRGTTCAGLLHPKGSGVEGDPITIDAYGDAADALPLLEGRGLTEAANNDIPLKLQNQTSKGIESAVVRLFNQEYWTIRNLEITNYSGDSGDYNKRRRGVVVALEDFGRGHGIEVSDLYIHDVLGLNEKDLGGSGGIQFEAYAGVDKKATSFGEIKVHHNVIRHVNRSGINEGSDFRTRNSVGSSIRDNPFAVWAPMSVHDNVVSDVGGDAIVTQFASGTEVYNNSVWAAANFHGGKSLSGNNAAVWAWDADNVKFYNNHVFDTVMPDGTWDGTAFDSDYGTTGTTFEYNVTHDNQGGFMLFCGCGGLSTQTVLRYNLSINDGRGGENHAEGARLFFIAGQTDGEVYNNTFLMYPEVIIDKSASTANAATYQNNVFLAQGAVKTHITEQVARVSPFRSNLYAGTEGNWPQATLNGNVVEKDLKPASGSGLEPALVAPEFVTEKGVAILKQDAVDLVNREVPLYGSPDLGAFQVTESAEEAAVTALSNGGFEEGTQGWTLSDGAAVSTDTFRGGDKGLTLAGSEATGSQSINAGANRNFRLVAAIKADADGNFPTITLSNPDGYVAVATPLDRAQTTVAGDWVNVSATMRTAWDGTELTVTITGPGAVDDIAVDLERDYMVDGSFQSLENTPFGGERTDDAVSGGMALSLGSFKSSENIETVVPDLGQECTLSAWIKGSDMALGAKNYGSAEEQVATKSTSDEYQQYALDLTPEQNRFTTFCYNESSAVAFCDDVTLVKKWNGEVAEIGEATPPVEPMDPPVEPTDPPVEPTDPTVEPNDPLVKPTDPTGEPTDPTDGEDLAQTGTNALMGASAILIALGAGGLLLLVRRKVS